MGMAVSVVIIDGLRIIPCWCPLMSVPQSMSIPCWVRVLRSWVFILSMAPGLCCIWTVAVGFIRIFSSVWPGYSCACCRWPT